MNFAALLKHSWSKVIVTEVSAISLPLIDEALNG
jgi:hypothetical protein